MNGDDAAVVDYLAMLGGVSVTQIEEALDGIYQAFRDYGVYSAELTPGLTFDDRRWIREMSEVEFQPPAQFAERWLQRAEGDR